MFDTILLATEGSAIDDCAYPVAEQMALRHGSKVVVVFVGAASSVSRRVHEQVAQLRELGVHARLAVIADGRDVASVFARLATAWRADLVVVGSGEPGAAERIMEGSPCPVLAVPGRRRAVRPPARAAAARSPARS